MRKKDKGKRTAGIRPAKQLAATAWGYGWEGLAAPRPSHVPEAQPAGALHPRSAGSIRGSTLRKSEGRGQGHAVAGEPNLLDRHQDSIVYNTYEIVCIVTTGLPARRATLFTPLARRSTTQGHVRSPRTIRAR